MTLLQLDCTDQDVNVRSVWQLLVKRTKNRWEKL